MNDNLTELVFILDKSGSMSGLEADTIGGYNAMLAKQKQEPGRAVVTTVLFDDQYERLHDRVDLAGLAPITEKEYFVGGTTALLDALGRTIKHIIKIRRRTREEDQPARTLFVITTDGQENASCKYSYRTIKSLVEREKRKYGWEFIFLGANIDAIATAVSFGIAPNMAADFHADSEGTRRNFEAVGCAITELRRTRTMPEAWRDEIDEDYRRRR
jgi:uncharacterized protein YegL